MEGPCGWPAGQSAGCRRSLLKLAFCLNFFHAMSSCHLVQRPSASLFMIGSIDGALTLYFPLQLHTHKYRSYDENPEQAICLA
jgi:hypothetical protein